MYKISKEKTKEIVDFCNWFSDNYLELEPTTKLCFHSDGVDNSKYYYESANKNFKLAYLTGLPTLARTGNASYTIQVDKNRAMGFDKNFIFFVLLWCCFRAETLKDTSGEECDIIEIDKLATREYFKTKRSKLGLLKGFTSFLSCTHPVNNELSRKRIELLTEEINKTKTNV